MPNKYAISCLVKRLRPGLQGLKSQSGKSNVPINWFTLDLLANIFLKK